MHDHTGVSFFREIILFLALAGVLIPLLTRLRINQILGFLAVGCLVGPYGLGQFTAQYPTAALFTFNDTSKVQLLAELGVIFLMFMIGLELSVERLLAMRRWVFGIGTLQVLLTALIVGVIAVAFGNRIESALVLGMVLAFSSTAVVMQLLVQRNELTSPTGRAVFAVLLLQDLAVVPIMLLVNLLGVQGEDSLLLAIALAAAKAALAIGSIYLLGRRAIRPLFHHLSRQGGADTFMALTLLATLGIAALTYTFGLSMALGALLAGLLLAETEYRHEVAVVIEPFKGLLMGLFFMSVGMGIDPAALLREPLWLPLSVVGLFVVKSLIAGFCLRLGGMPYAAAAEGGLLLGQGGEFALIVIGVAMSGGLLDATTGQFMLLVVSLSLFATPLVARAARTLATNIEQRWPQHDNAAQLALTKELSGHVIIAGYGRVGQHLASVLDEQQITSVVVEKSADTVHNALHLRNVVLGDAARPELLRMLGVGRCAAVVLTMDHAEAAISAASAIRREFPSVPIVARARDEEHAAALCSAGASLVVPEALEATLQLCDFVLSTLGVPNEAITRILDAQRQLRLARFRR